MLLRYISLNNIKCEIINIKIIYKKFYIKGNRDRDNLLIHNLT